jgi:molecular chaperone GrpE
LSEDKLANGELGSEEAPESDQDLDQAAAADQLKGDIELEDGGELEIAAEPTLEDRLAEAEAKAAEYLDGWQRARAEFANARKRAERQRTEAYSSAAVDFGKRLLPVVDDLGRALESAPPEIAENSWFEGLDLVNRKVRSILESMDIKPIEALGQPFDPNYHEALALKEAGDVESGLVIEELQIGYSLGDKVIRPSLVNVSA